MQNKMRFSLNDFFNFTSTSLSFIRGLKSRCSHGSEPTPRREGSMGWGLFKKWEKHHGPLRGHSILIYRTKCVLAMCQTGKVGDSMQHQPLVADRKSASINPLQCVRVLWLLMLLLLYMREMMDGVGPTRPSFHMLTCKWPRDLKTRDHIFFKLALSGVSSYRLRSDFESSPPPLLHFPKNKQKRNCCVGCSLKAGGSKV